jgi:pimeloyl-ACP methyl ester carboxylesterase
MSSTAYRSHFLTMRDGLKVHVREYGERHLDRLPAVCLPGLSRNSADFHVLAAALASDNERPRRVLAVDYRGRGLSEHDANWRNYDIKVELDDVLQVAAGLGASEAIWIGTSRGGLITMAMAPVRPAGIRGVVLNDIGPIIDAQGLIRIRGYIGKLPTPRSIEDAVDILKQVFGGQFPALDDTAWRGWAERNWSMADGMLTQTYDPALAKPLAELDLEAPMPVMWPLFEGLGHAPVLVLRGEHSDLLSAATVAEMTRRHPRCRAFTVPGQGHAPLLEDAATIARIKALCTEADGD